jgi:hypothetical protein
MAHRGCDPCQGKSAPSARKLWLAGHGQWDPVIAHTEMVYVDMADSLANVASSREI